MMAKQKVAFLGPVSSYSHQVRSLTPPRQRPHPLDELTAAILGDDWMLSCYGIRTPSSGNDQRYSVSAKTFGLGARLIEVQISSKQCNQGRSHEALCPLRILRMALLSLPWISSPTDPIPTQTSPSAVKRTSMSNITCSAITLQHLWPSPMIYPVLRRQHLQFQIL